MSPILFNRDITCLDNDRPFHTCVQQQSQYPCFKQVRDWMILEKKQAFPLPEKPSPRTTNELWKSWIYNRIGHYQTGLLWRENAKLPNNRWLAEKQVKQLDYKLNKTPEPKIKCQ